MSLLSELASRHCSPLRGQNNALPEDKIAGYLTALPGWDCIEDGQAIAKTFEFPDYYRTIAFVNALAFIANREDHHPDLGVHYNKAVVRFSTHDVGGLSLNDFICAAKTEQLV